MPRLWRLVVTAAVVAGVVTPAALNVPAKADEVTISQNQARTGWDPNEPSLSPQAVKRPSFGRLFETSVTGQVYAQPLVVGNNVIVATEENWVYGLNPTTGVINWKTNLGPAWPSSAVGCLDLTPWIGVTSTPVYDPVTREVYLAAVENNGSSLYVPHIYLVALNARTGHRDWQSLIQGTSVNDKAHSFDPLTQRQRASLLLMNGAVYVGFSSYCDFKPYVGLIAGVNTSTHLVSLWSDEAGVSGKQAGIWMSDSGLMSDGAGRIFATSGNGVSPAPGPGNKPPSTLAESVFRLSVQPGGSLAARDFFSPANAPKLDAADQDLGSGGPVALPFGTTAHPRLLLQAGKDGRLFILDRDNLGGRGSTTDHPVSLNGPYLGQWNHPAAFAGTGGNDFVYYLGTRDFLRALKFSTKTAKLTDAGNSPGTFPYGSGSPVVTSNGSNPASAVVWVVDRTGTNSALDAFTAIPRDGKLTQLWSAPIGTAAKFSAPATDRGRVYVGSDGEVFGFGTSLTAPLAAAPLSFNSVPVAGNATQSVTVTAKTAVTVTGASTTSTALTDPFSAGKPKRPGGSATFPMKLKAGNTLTVPITFKPTSPGGDSGSLDVATTTPNFAAVSVPLSGDSTRTGFYATLPALRFGTVPTDSSLTLQTVIANGGTSTERWSTLVPPVGSRFTITSQPAAGTQIPAGQSVTLSVTYVPTGTASDSSSFSEPSSTRGGTAATVSLSGIGIAGKGMLSAAPGNVAFGSVALGQQSSASVDVTNTGNLPMTITGFTAPGTPFGTPQPVTTPIRSRINTKAAAAPSPVPSITVPSGVPTTVPPSATPPDLALEVATSNRYGPILVTPAGRTVYRPEGGCACDPEYQPLLAALGQPLRLPVLVSGAIGTVKRVDGTLQVTFDGSPLFTLSGDHVQGDTNGAVLHWRVIEVNANYGG